MWRPAQSWGAHKVVGVDIDDALIRAAWRRRRSVWSCQASDGSGERFEGDNPKKRKREMSENLANTAASDYFPISCEHMFGPLPIPPSQNRGAHVFPHNILFRMADWTETEIPEDADGYDVVIA